MRSVGLARGLTCLLLVLTVPIVLLAQRPQRQATRQLPAPRYIPSRDYDTQNIKLELRFDWEHEQALGTETITLSPLVTNLNRVDLDAANMTFNSVKLASGVLLNLRTLPRKKSCQSRWTMPINQTTPLISSLTITPMGSQAHMDSQGLAGD